MYKDKKSKMLAEEKIPNLLMNLSIPAIMGMLMSAVYNVVDTIFVGRVGIQAIGAVTVVFPFFMLLSGIGMTFGGGSASFISRLLGENRKELADKVASTSLFTTSILGIVFTIVSYLFLAGIVKFFGATDTILPSAIEYGSIIVLGTIFTVNNMNMNNMVRAEGNIKVSMVSMITGAVLNIILDPLFIFGFNMGVAGAAWATLISQAVSMFILLYFYFSGKSVVNIKMSNFEPSFEIYSEVIKMGMPTLLRQLLTSTAMALLNNTAGYYGDIYVASIGIINRLYSLAIMVVLGFGQGLQPVAGFNFGAKMYDRLLESIRVTIKRTTIYCVIMTLIFIIFSRQIISIFTPNNEVIDTASTILRYFSSVLPVIGFSISINILYQAIGRALPAGFLSVSRQGVFFIPALLILPQFIGVKTIFVAQPLADSLTFVITLILFIRTYKQFLIMRDNVHDEKPAIEPLS